MNKLTGLSVNFPKNGESSENLLLLPTLTNIHGKRALILQGKNGRKKLGNVLKKRGVKVEYCECYYRKQINYNGEEQGNRMIKLGINTLVVTSGEMLKQLYYLLPKNHRKSWLICCKLIVVSNRLAYIAKRLGWKDIVMAKTANNKDLIKLLLNI